MNTPRLLEFIKNRQKFTQSRLTFYGYVFDNLIVPRDPSNKVATSEGDWPHRNFPPYCYGNFFLLTTDLMPVLYNLSFTTLSILLDDAYIGILAKENKNIKFVHFEHNLLFDQKNDAVLNNLELNNKYLVFGKTNSNDICSYARIWSYILQKSFKRADY